MKIHTILFISTHLFSNTNKIVYQILLVFTHKELLNITPLIFSHIFYDFSCIFNQTFYFL